MTVRTARNAALIALIVVALAFSLETAALGAFLQGSGQDTGAVDLLVWLSIGGLMVAVLACARAVFVVHERPASPQMRQPATRRTREDALVA